MTDEPARDSTLDNAIDKHGGESGALPMTVGQLLAVIVALAVAIGALDLLSLLKEPSWTYALALLASVLLALLGAAIFRGKH